MIICSPALRRLSGCPVSPSSARHVAAGAVATAAGEHHDDSQHDEHANREARSLDPARCWRGAKRIGHVSLLVQGRRQGVRDQTVLSIQNVSIKTLCLLSGHKHQLTYAGVVPKLWNETIEAHRRAVRDAIAGRHRGAGGQSTGCASVTMSQIAEETGIGRATLYKYFPDVEAILVAWHERQVAGHLEHLAEVRDQAGDAGERLEAVLRPTRSSSHEHHGSELAALLHRGEHVARAQQQLSGFIRDLLTEGARRGDLRDDVAPDELASYCLHALTAASSLPSKAAVRRLVAVTLAGLRATR